MNGRHLVWERAHGLCEVAFECAADHFHHRWKDGQGGPDTASNGLAVCFRHHHQIEHEPTWAKGWGWWLEPWLDPATSPVFLARSGWVLLNDDGSMTRTSPPED